MSGTVETEKTAPDSGRPIPTLWRILGVKRVKRRYVPFGLTLWAKMGYAVLIVVGGSLAFAEYSMEPDFCRNCHLMEPYYQAWHESTHKDVPCVDCHMEPGIKNTLKGKWQASSQVAKYVTRTYGSKPHAEIRDESCLREGCHDQRLLEGLVEWEVPTQRGDKIKIHFNHAPHLGELRRGKELRCSSCHSQIVQGQHLVVTLDTCFTCHFKGVKHGRDEEVLGGCGSCHGAPKGDIRLATGLFNHQEYLDRKVACENCHSEAIKGDGEVPRQLCWTCHNQPQQLAKYGETQLMHRAHVSEHKLECSNCHVQIEHHLTANPNRALSLAGMIHETGESSEGCAQCHSATHSGPAKMYSGVGGFGVPNMPSPMFTSQVDCIACHLEETSGASHGVSGYTYLAAQKACDTCHGTRYTGVLDVWKNSVDLLLSQAQAAVEEARVALDGASITDDAERLALQRLFNDASQNVEFVRTAHGVHNITYATALLNLSIDNCNEIGSRLGASPAENEP
ncbi:MAG: NapC/NirT family cytochrome c [Phycisphaerales bacterium]|nr:NapC/NirT family cytochrome c [Phycisphaerales bacterium]